MSAQFQSGL